MSSRAQARAAAASPSGVRRLRRLRRANGLLATIVTMIEEGRSAIDIAQQMQAVIKALESAKTTLIAHHIERRQGPLLARDRRHACAATKRREPVTTT